ncbi:TIM barrel protein [Caloramator sp. E03]|uniref:sugar phosphate isomerase/epimerase family protein n=1 Tax=Caloramator sp. E03 TaxID=2576307 RepID=UPI001110C25B|nr:sugar phosphate isomerase/epimerase [Caloramator sp. E03]QCX34307.1 TIM barrel protein [Caloramator sp. E03]
MSNIKLGISLYCFTNEYIKGIYTLEDCIKTAAELGAEGYEIVATQMIPSYPYVNEKFLGEIKAMSAAYGIKPICYAANTDKGLRCDRNLTDDEILTSTINDIKSAHKLGCKIMRVQYLLSPEVMAKLAPYAEEYGIKIGVEMHNPETPSSEAMQKYLEVFEKTGSKYIGFIPDLGCFATKPNKPHWDEAIAKGAPVELLEMAAQMRYDGVPRNEARERLIKAGANGAVLGCFEAMNGFVTFYKEPDLEGLKKVMPYCIHFHGKFHYIYDNLEEASIPYDKVLPVIKDSDFEGYIMSEYEDHISGRAVEMTKKHLLMERKILFGE